ncbi:MAG: putative quinol monooxygenase [Pseudomonadota bacterium]
MIIVWGSVQTTEDNKTALLSACHEHVSRSRQEPGCIEHGAYIDSENPLRITFFERWDDAAALKTHFAVSESAAFVGKLRELSTGEPEMAVYTANEGMD